MTEIVSEGVVIRAAVAAGDYLIPVGAELQMDQHLLSGSTVLGAKELTILATQGYSTVKVRRQPVVAVLATGSELVEVGKSLDQNGVFASNLHTVSHLVNHYGGRARVLGIAGDQVERLAPLMEEGSRADVIVTTGGTGKGEKDLVSGAIRTLGGDVLFHGVAMSPGKQALFAKLGGTLLFGLPGRPAATYIAFEQLVRPVLLQNARFFTSFSARNYRCLEWFSEGQEKAAVFSLRSFDLHPCRPGGGISALREEGDPHRDAGSQLSATDSSGKRSVGERRASQGPIA